MAPFHRPTIGPNNSNLIDFHKDSNQFFFSFRTVVTTKSPGWQSAKDFLTKK
jgi:hypothetical protein